MPDHHDLVALDEDTCWELLAGVGIARVGISMGERMHVLPVNHLVHERRVYWRSGAGTKLGVAAAEAQVAVEADEIDQVGHVGWSVVVHGRASIVNDPGTLDALHARDFAPWSAVDQKVLWIEVVPDEVTGRRLGHA